MYVGSAPGSKDGVLTVGGVDPRLYRGHVQYTPIMERSYYCIAAEGLQIGNRSVISEVYVLPLF